MKCTSFQIKCWKYLNWNVDNKWNLKLLRAHYCIDAVNSNTRELWLVQRKFLPILQYSQAFSHLLFWEWILVDLLVIMCMVGHCPKPFWWSAKTHFHNHNLFFNTTVWKKNGKDSNSNFLRKSPEAQNGVFVYWLCLLFLPLSSFQLEKGEILSQWIQMDWAIHMWKWNSFQIQIMLRRKPKRLKHHWIQFGMKRFHCE